MRRCANHTPRLLRAQTRPSLLLLSPQSIVSIQRIALHCQRRGAAFPVRSVYTTLLVAWWSFGVCGAIDGRSPRSGRLAPAATAGWNGRWAEEVPCGLFTREELLREFLLAATLGFGAALLGFFLFLELKGKRQVVVFLFGG